MPPKKDTTSGDGKLLVGFEDKETKLLAAAFVSCIGPDKYDYDLMATLTNNTAGSLKKMWPPVKKKAIDAHASFAAFLGATGANMAGPKSTAAPKASGGRKRKATTDTEPELDVEADIEVNTKDAKPKLAPKSKGSRKSKPATASPDNVETADKPKATRSSSRKTSEEPKSAAADNKKKAPTKTRPAKKNKKEEVKSEEDSADGGDGLGQYTRKEKVQKWLNGTDEGLETIEEEEA